MKKPSKSWAGHKTTLLQSGTSLDPIGGRAEIPTRGNLGTLNQIDDGIFTVTNDQPAIRSGIEGFGTTRANSPKETEMKEYLFCQVCEVLTLHFVEANKAILANDAACVICGQYHVSAWTPERAQAEKIEQELEMIYDDKHDLLERQCWESEMAWEKYDGNWGEFEFPHEDIYRLLVEEESLKHKIEEQEREAKFTTLLEGVIFMPLSTF